jgi:hypothetical protein
MNMIENRYRDGCMAGSCPLCASGGCSKLRGTHSKSVLFSVGVLDLEREYCRHRSIIPVRSRSDLVFGTENYVCAVYLEFKQK